MAKKQNDEKTNRQKKKALPNFQNLMNYILKVVNPTRSGPALGNLSKTT